MKTQWYLDYEEALCYLDNLYPSVRIIKPKGWYDGSFLEEIMPAICAFGFMGLLFLVYWWAGIVSF